MLKHIYKGRNEFKERRMLLFLFNEKDYISLRKFTVGTASILVGATLILVTLTMRQKQLKKIIWKILLNSIENDNDKTIKN